MSKEEFIEKIKELKLNVPDEQFFLEYNAVVFEVLDREEKLIKYLEDKIKGCDYFTGTIKHNFEELKLPMLTYKKVNELLKTNKLVKDIYQDILERCKNNNYE